MWFKFSLVNYLYINFNYNDYKNCYKAIYKN